MVIDNSTVASNTEGVPSLFRMSNYWIISRL